MAEDHDSPPSSTLGPVKEKKAYSRLDKRLPLQHQGFVLKRTSYAATETLDDKRSMGVDDLGFGSGQQGYVELSLNKKNRWKIVDDARENPEEYKGDFDRLRILEGEWCPGQAISKGVPWETWNPKGLTSVREFTDDMEVLKKSKKRYGMYTTLTGKERPSRRERARNPELDREPEQGESVVEYTVYSGCTRDGLREKEQRKHLNSGSHLDHRSYQFEHCGRRAPRSAMNLIGPDPVDAEIDGLIDAEIDDPEIDLETIAQYSRPSRKVELIDQDLLDWVPFKEVKSKKGKKHRKRQTTISESELKDKGHVRYLGGSSGSEGSNEGFDIIEMNPNLVRLNFSPVMPRVDVKIPKSEIDTDRLKTKFGANYRECDSVPRAFSIDISTQVQQALERGCGELKVRNIVTTSEVNFMLKSKTRMGYSHDDGNAALSVSLNCLVTDEVESLAFNTIHEGMEFHEIEEIIDRAANCLALLPLESFTRVTAAKDIPYLSAIRRFEPDTACVSKETATKSVLSEAFDQCLHRQLSKIESYMRQPSHTPYLNSHCGICYEEATIDREPIGLFACGHRFCEECWANHIGQQIYHGKGRIKCPEFDCDVEVPMSFILLLLPQRVAAMYAAQLRDTKVNAASKWMWCINPHCQRLLHISSPGISNDVIACGCGTKWCPRCEREPHWPTGCEAFEGYNKQMESVGDNLSLAQRRAKISFVNVKRCPHCSTPMEKGFGCNHISCVCGRAFCWHCLGNWGSDGYDNHQKCGTKSGRGFEEHFLFDVMTDGQTLPKKSYQRCIFHRHAKDASRLKDLKRAFYKYLTLDDILIDQLSTLSILDRVTSTPGELPTRDELIRFLLHYYSQGHHLLEFVNVWLGLNKKHKVHSLVKSTVDTAAFFIGRFEENCLDGLITKAVDTLGHIEGAVQDLLTILSPVAKPSSTQ